MLLHQHSVLGAIKPKEFLLIFVLEQVQVYIRLDSSMTELEESMSFLRGHQMCSRWELHGLLSINTIILPLRASIVVHLDT